MLALLNELQGAHVEWYSSKESPFLFHAHALDRDWTLRLNDFPDEPLCTVFVDGEGHFSRRVETSAPSW
jgi:hypothetical protein